MLFIDCKFISTHCSARSINTFQLTETIFKITVGTIMLNNNTIKYVVNVIIIIVVVHKIISIIFLKLIYNLKILSSRNYTIIHLLNSV